MHQKFQGILGKASKMVNCSCYLFSNETDKIQKMFKGLTLKRCGRPKNSKDFRMFVLDL